MRYPVFFWGKAWTQRGIGFVKQGSQRNVHYIDLIASRGCTWRIKFMWFRYAWSRLLTFGYV